MTTARSPSCPPTSTRPSSPTNPDQGPSHVQASHPAAGGRSRAPGPVPLQAHYRHLAAIYPTITLLLAVFEPLGLLDQPLPIRTLLLTAVPVPLMVFVLVPTLTRLLGRWLRP
jgi:hypothetical protein